VSAPPDDLQPTRETYVAPSGKRIAVVLVAIVVGIAVLCLACLLGYMFYVDRRQR
jgi:multisubunit Na+/H+ antiporter MnhC subunit